MGAPLPQSLADGEWWRFAAGSIYHASPTHIFFNMTAFLILGRSVENRLGSWRFVLLYLAASVLSLALACAYYASHGSKVGILVGASGGIMGLVGAELAVVLRALRVRKASWLKADLRRLLLTIVLQTSIDALIPNISMSAHLSGAVCGFVLVFLLGQAKENTES